MNAETQWTITKIVELCYQQSTSLSLASQCTGPSPPPWWDAINADEKELCLKFGKRVTLPACHFPLRPPGWKRDRLYMRFLFSQVFVFFTSLMVGVSLMSRLYMMSLFSQVVSNGFRLWNHSHWEHWNDNSLHAERRQEKKEETEYDVKSSRDM